LLHLLIIAEESEGSRKLRSDLETRGYLTSLVSDYDRMLEGWRNQAVDLVLLEVPSRSSDALELRRLVRRIKEQRPVPVLVLLTEEGLEDYDFAAGAEDFILSPYRSAEVIARIRQILWHSGKLEKEDIIQCGDLVIDLARYQVSLAGRPIALTFKEYELLKFMVLNRGKALTRETLLNKVWGYDYFGGDRTVDVHIRRLRSKIEDKTHSFIDTVRNVGYRFRE
jgi:DNA-binding response OmpR family regulator